MLSSGEWGFNPLEDPTQNPFDIAKQAAFEIAVATGIGHHDVALTVGSGWGTAVELIGKTTEEIPAEEITGFSASGIPGHLGTIRSVLLPNNKRALVIGARTHLYEGAGRHGFVRRVVHSVRTAAAAGAATMILTNGVGGIRPAWQPGTAVLVKDHLNLTGTTPIEGATFLDLTEVYSTRLRAIAHSVDPSLGEGVLAQVPGPQYETPAEVQMLRGLGADIVGMSICLEAIAAREAGMDVLGLSLVTNLAAGISGKPLSHKEVLETGAATQSQNGALLAAIMEKI
jgi:purine-nucleoside phosphorylase